LSGPARTLDPYRKGIFQAKINGRAKVTGWEFNLLCARVPDQDDGRLSRGGKGGDGCYLMAKKWIRHLLATENDTLVGILSVRDLIKTAALKDRPWFLRQKKGFFLTAFLD